MRHSVWYPDRVIRLFKRGAARFSDDLVHEKIIASNAIGRWHEHLQHESFTSFEAVLDKVNRYSTAGALTLFKRVRKGSLGAAFGHGIWAFFRTYVLRFGFLDGRMGLGLAPADASKSPQLLHSSRLDRDKLKILRILWSPFAMLPMANERRKKASMSYLLKIAALQQK